jgi:hypothetical protein
MRSESHRPYTVWPGARGRRSDNTVHTAWHVCNVIALSFAGLPQTSWRYSWGRFKGCLGQAYPSMISWTATRQSFLTWSAKILLQARLDHSVRWSQWCKRASTMALAQMQSLWRGVVCGWRAGVAALIFGGSQRQGTTTPKIAKTGPSYARLCLCDSRVLQRTALSAARMHAFRKAAAARRNVPRTAALGHEMTRSVLNVDASLPPLPHMMQPTILL